MHSPPDPAPLDDLVIALSRRLRREWAQALAPWGLSPHQGRALRVVATDGSLRVGDLAEALRIAPRSATEVVDGLVGQGLLERAADPDDRRATRVVVTDAGRRVSEQVVAARGARTDEVFAVLSPVERSFLARILGALATEPVQPAEHAAEHPAEQPTEQPARSARPLPAVSDAGASARP